MPCCAIRSCRIRRGSLEAKRANISFHILPKDREKRLEWVNKINRPGWKPNFATVLCSRHFTAFDFPGTTKYKKLFKGSVPTLHLNDPLDEKTMALKAKERKPRKPKTKYVNVMLQNASNMEKIPLMDIKVESITDQPTCHSEIINQERSVIADIIKNIMYSLDLLIKSDPDNVRSANVRDKIIAVLFTYQDFMDDKELNVASYKEVDIFDNSNNLKEIDVVYKEDNNSDDLNMSGDDSFNDNNMEDSVNSNVRKKENTSGKYIRVEAKEKKRCVDNEDSDHFIDEISHSDFDDQTFSSNLRNNDLILSKEAEVKTTIKILKQKTAVSKSRKMKTSKNKDISEILEEDDETLTPIKTEYSKDNIGFVSAVPRYVCDICDVTVISEHHLTVHKHLCKMRHYYYGNPLLEEYWSDLKCPLCDVTCTHRGNLVRHYVNHRVKDIEMALEPIKERELNPDTPENNMKLLNDFIAEFEYKEKIEKEKTINIGSALIQHSGNIDSAIQEGSDTNHEKAELRVISKKPSIDDYVQFNVKKIVYDVDINKQLYCFPCDILFNTKDELEEHRKKLNNTDVFVCNHCDKTFDTSPRLIDHANTHRGLYNRRSLYLNYKPEETEGCPRQIDYKIYVCKYCLVIFVQECSLHSHLGYYKKHHKCYTKINKSSRGSVTKKTPPGIKRTADDKLQCNKCEKSYGNYYLFLEHLASHSEILKYHCECGRGFKSKQRLRFHINLVHTKKFEVICEVCGLKVLYQNLRRHMKVHSSLKPYKCSYCNKTFKYKESVTSHTRTHTHEKPWQCHYCGVAFSEKRGYNTHINIHEGRTPYKCDQCPSAFVSKLKLNAHITEHTDCRKAV